MISLQNIKKVYNKGKANAYEALHGVSLHIADGELVAIVGTSGAGKSTLLHILACIDSYEDGEYKIDDTLVKNLSEKKLAGIRNQKIGMVMQDFALVEDFTALQNVMLPLDFAAKKIKDKKTSAKEALKRVGMEQYASKPVNKLSGGQKQRIAIARAIVNDPNMILADEPTGALDSKTSAEIMQLFHTLHKAGNTIIIVTHDPNIAAQCERVIRIEDGNIERRKINEKNSSDLVMHVLFRRSAFRVQQQQHRPADRNDRPDRTDRNHHPNRADRYTATYRRRNG